MRLTTNEKINIIKWFNEFKQNSINKTIKIIIIKFEEEYNKPSPHQSSILYIVNKFNKYGTVLNRQKGIKHKKSVATEKNIEKVKNCLFSGKANSKRKIAKIENIKPSSVLNILRDQLKLYPYKVAVGQMLTNNAIQQRIDFSHKMLQRIEEHEHYFNNILFTDESHFHLNGVVN